MDDRNDTLTNNNSVFTRILEADIAAGFRIWHLIFFIIFAIFITLVLLCCCIRFRIPRTKQEIEADHVRKKITRKFRKHLHLLHDSEMDEMDLLKALERIRNELILSDPATAIVIHLNCNERDEMKSEEDKTNNQENFEENGHNKRNEGSLEELVEDMADSSNNKFVNIVNALNTLRKTRNTPQPKKDTQIEIFKS